MEITKKTGLIEILENYPQAAKMFRELGMHCLGCALASMENIEQACLTHGHDPDEFVAKLKAFLEIA